MILQEAVLFNKPECDEIISLIKSNPQNWEFKDRRYDSMAINYNNDSKWLFDKLKLFFESNTDLSLLKLKNQIHFHKFIKGDWFDKHNDVNEKRLYAVGVLLNDDFKGGDFKLYNPNEILLNKITGNTYVFDVRISHEITPILNGERYSLLWFLQHEHIKIKTNKLI
jgi:hypothetical protein